MAQTEKPQVRAGCYHRISSDPKDKKQGTARQREDTAILCEVQGWVIAGDYTDDNRSASNGKDRPEWKRLLADIKAGKVDAIAAWDQDRNWRMMHELEDLRKFFAGLDREVKLATTGQGVIDLSSPSGVLLAQMKTAVSEHEIATMRVRQLRAARQKAEQGKPKWKRAFGYHPDTRPKKDDDGTRVVNEEQQALVVAAYQAVLKGEKITNIARQWNQAGVTGLNGEPWSASTVSLFLRSPRNAGLRSHNDTIVLDAEGEPVKGTWPALVDEDLWRQVQAVLGKNAHGPKSVRVYLLSGILRCGRSGCSGRLGGVWVAQPTGGQPGRLKAGAVRRQRQKVHRIAYTCKVCHRLSVRAERVEPLIRALLTDRLSRPDAEKLLRAKVGAAEARKLRAEEARVRAKLLERQEMLDNDEMTREQFARSTAKLRAQLDAITQRQQCQQRLRVLEDIPLGTPEVAAKVAALSPDRLRAILDALAVITVRPVGKQGKTFDPERIQVAWKD